MPAAALRQDATSPIPAACRAATSYCCSGKLVAAAEPCRRKSQRACVVQGKVPKSYMPACHSSSHQQADGSLVVRARRLLLARVLAQVVAHALVGDLRHRYSDGWIRQQASCRELSSGADRACAGLLLPRTCACQRLVLVLRNSDTPRNLRHVDRIYSN